MKAARQKQMETISEEDRAKTKKKEADRIKAMRQEKSKEEKVKNQLQRCRSKKSPKERKF